jgi:hypothetical protein
MVHPIQENAAPARRAPQRDWYRDARVRSAARPGVSQTGGGTAYFAADLQPHVTHPLVQARGSDVERELLCRALCRYLHATSVLEIRVVNAVAAEIAHGDLGRDLPAKARQEALELTCDEGYHAVVASDLLAQIGGERQHATPAFFERLCALREQSADSAEASIVRFLFTVVTETSISANLRHLAHSPEVLPAVRDFVADHARDEAWHGAYFSALFAGRWARCSEAERSRYGRLLPELAFAYLTPDTAAIAADLRDLGLCAGDVDTVMAEAYSSAAQREAVRRASSPLMACVRRAGAMSGETRDAFVRAGLLVEES